MFNENYVKFWAPLLNALVHMFEESVDTSTPQVTYEVMVYYSIYINILYSIPRS